VSERLTPPASLSPEQQAALEAFQAARGAAPFGPFATLLHSPELMLRASALGQYLRYGTELPPRLSELAILMVARAHDQPVEWAIHQPIALAAGVLAETADAVARGERPTLMAPDEAVLHDTCAELIKTRTVSDAVYARALSAFGEKGVLDLAGLVGYYSLLALCMNLAGTEPPNGPTLPRR